MARVARLGFIPPQLPSLTDQPPEGADWIHEVKHEGYRTMLLVERGRLRPYPQWAQLERPIPRHYCSGTQAFVPVGNPRWRGHCAGRTRCVFEALQVALRSRPSRLIFYAFDLLHLDGKDLLDRPLVERRAKLLELVRHDQESPIQFSEEFIGDAAAFFRACAAHELEGRSARGFRGKARQTETGLLRLAGSLHRKNPRVSFLPF